MKRLSSLVSSLLIAGVLLSGCGGPQDPPPTPLSTRFEDKFIAQVAPDKQGGVLEAQTGYNAAKMEMAKADADLSDAKVALEAARNDTKSSANDLDTAKKEKVAADKTADQTRIGQANKDLATAELASKSAKARQQYLQSYTDFLLKVQRYTNENQFWREAQYELAKAKVAQTNNIAPPGFAVAKFDQQEVSRAQRTGKAKDKAASFKQKAAADRDTWLRLQAETDNAKGGKSQFPDPMGNSQAGSTL
jgi:hypothetical protein